MFTNIRIKNFQSLVDLNVNLLKTSKKAKNMVVIYGENGAGKTNFASTFQFLFDSLRTISYKDRISVLMEKGLFKNPSNETYQMIKSYFIDTETLIEKYKTIDSKDNLVLEFEFSLKNKRGIYRFEYNNNELVSEKLDYVLLNNTINLFNITKEKRKINDNIYLQNSYNIEIDDQLDKYWGKHTFLSILHKERQDKTSAFFKKNMHKSLLKVLDFFLALSIKRNSFSSPQDINGFNFISGEISLKKIDYLDKTERMLNNFFTHLYSDIKEVYYKKKLTDKDCEYELFVKKLVYNRIIDLNFNKESTGTKNLILLLPYIIQAIRGDIVIIDEMDYGIHDLLVQHLLNNVKNYIKGQLIITSHNTLLLEKVLKKENIFVFLINKEAHKELISLDAYGEREHKNFNLRKRYLQGIYGGVPFPAEIDFEEIVNYLKDA